MYPFVIPHSPPAGANGNPQSRLAARIAELNYFYSLPHPDLGYLPRLPSGTRLPNFPSIRNGAREGVPDAR
jgi:hypothetical protein